MLGAHWALQRTIDRRPRYTAYNRYTGRCTACGDLMENTLIVVDPDIQSGTPVFAGTRVPIQNLFDYLEEGDSLEIFLRQFPSVTREQAVAVLEQARTSLMADAHPS